MALKFEDVVGALRRSAKPASLVAIPAMYLAGTAYHQGYLEGLGVNTTLLPLGVNDTYLQAFLGTVSVLTRVIEFCGAHGVVSGSLSLVLVIVLTLLLHKKEAPSEQTGDQVAARLVDASGAPIGRIAQKSVSARVKPLSDVLDSFFVVGASTYFFLLAILGFSFFTVFFVATPYFYAGKAEAKKDLKAKFHGQSEALIVHENVPHLFSIVECGSDFCVVYSTSEGVVSVPRSTVTWVNAAKLNQ